MYDKLKKSFQTIVIVIFVILVLFMFSGPLFIAYVHVEDYLEFIGNRHHAFDYLMKNYGIEFSLVNSQKGAVSSWVSSDIDDKFTFYDITNDRYLRLVYGGASNMKDEYAIAQIEEKIGRELPKVIGDSYINSNLEIFDSSAVFNPGVYREAYRNFGIYSLSIDFDFSGGLSTSKELPFEYIYCDLSVRGDDPWTKQQAYRLFSFLKDEFPGLNIRFYTGVEEGIFSKFPIGVQLTDSLFSSEEEFYKVARME